MRVLIRRDKKGRFVGRRYTSSGKPAGAAAGRGGKGSRLRKGARFFALKVATALALCLVATTALHAAPRERWAALFSPSLYDVVCTTAVTSCGGGATFAGGTVSGATAFTSTVTFGGALDAANTITLGRISGCVEFEGSSADGNSTHLCVANPTGTAVFNLPNIGGATRTIAFSDGTQTWTSIQTFTGTLNYIGGVTAVTTTQATATTTSAATFTNTGDTDGATVTLLDNAAAGTWWNFAVTVAQTLTITPGAGESLYLGADQCVVSITSNVIGSTLTIRTVVGGSGGVFMSFGPTGTWVCNDV